MYKIVPSPNQKSYALLRQLDPGEERYYRDFEYITDTQQHHWLPLASGLSAVKLNRLAKAYTKIKNNSF